MKKTLLIILIIFLTIVICICSSGLYDRGEVIESGKSNSVVRSNALTMMYETGYKTGEYQVTSDNVWPGTDAYTFNETLSRCENGSKLYWDSNTNRVMMEATTADKCYVYFDSKLITFNIAGIQYNAEIGMTWEEWINSSYNSADLYIFNHGIFNSVKSKLFFLANNDDDDFTVYPENTIDQGNNYDFTEKPSIDSHYLSVIGESQNYYNLLYLNESFLITLLESNGVGNNENVEFILNVNNGTIAEESIIQTLINDLPYYISDEVYELTNHLPLMPFIYTEPIYDGLLYNGLFEISFSLGSLSEGIEEIIVLQYSIDRDMWVVVSPDKVDYDNKEITILLEDMGPFIIMGIYN